jgi:dTDP-glucose pyrophosphorylase
MISTSKEMYLSLHKIKKIILKENCKIIDVVNNLNESGLKIVLIINKNNNFKGVLTDGDIRRALIKKLNINDEIKDIINKNPKFINFKDKDKDKIKKNLNFQSIDAIPIIKKRKIFGLFVKNNYEINNPIIIMAGGYGKRLGLLTKNNPKGMLKYKGRPLLEHIISNAKKNYFTNFYISVFYLKNKIKNYFKNGSDINIKIEYIEEKKPLGTIGGLRNLKNINKDFIVTNCDVISNIDYNSILKFHIKNKADLTIAVTKFTYRNPYGVINAKKNIFLSFEEKPEINFNINAGLYVFNPKIINIIKKFNFKQINELVDYLNKNNFKILLFPLYEKWLDMGLNKKINLLDV